MPVAELYRKVDDSENVDEEVVLEMIVPIGNAI